VIFRYAGARRRVRAAGAHGLDLAMFRKVHVTVESAPLARKALQEDRVIEVVTDLDRELSPAYAGQLRARRLVCTPMVSGGRWVGVVLSDRPPDAPPLTDDERDLLWTLGKTAALAAMARIATRQSVKARQLQQRIDMAREIHDGVIQRLFGVSLALSVDAPMDDDPRERCRHEVQLDAPPAPGVNVGAVMLRERDTGGLLMQLLRLSAEQRIVRAGVVQEVEGRGDGSASALTAGAAAQMVKQPRNATAGQLRRTAKPRESRPPRAPGTLWRLLVHDHLVDVDDGLARRPCRGHRPLPCLDRELLAPLHVGLALPKRDRGGLATLAVHTHRDTSEPRLLF
jgi:hypothetical protein